MKTFTVIFLIVFIVHSFSLSLNKKFGLKNFSNKFITTNASSSHDILGNKSDLTTDEEKVSYCNSLKDWDISLDELILYKEKLTQQFQNHVDLYQGWSRNAINQRDKEILNLRENIYMNDFMKHAQSIYPKIDGIKDKMKEYNSLNCKELNTSSNTNEKPISNNVVDETPIKINDSSISDVTNNNKPSPTQDKQTNSDDESHNNINKSITESNSSDNKPNTNQNDSNNSPSQEHNTPNPENNTPSQEYNTPNRENDSPSQEHNTPNPENDSLSQEHKTPNQNDKTTPDNTNKPVRPSSIDKEILPQTDSISTGERKRHRCMYRVVNGTDAFIQTIIKRYADLKLVPQREHLLFLQMRQKDTTKFMRKI